MWRIRKVWFIATMMAAGMSYKSAVWHWHLHCLELATIISTGAGMGNFKVVNTKDGNFSPNNAG